MALYTFQQLSKACEIAANIARKERENPNPMFVEALEIASSLLANARQKAIADEPYMIVPLTDQPRVSVFGRRRGRPRRK